MDENKNTFSEQKEFLHSIDMKTTIDEVSRNLGFNTNLGQGQVKLMYDICRYEKAFEPQKVSPWCAAFTIDNLKASFNE